MSVRRRPGKLHAARVPDELERTNKALAEEVAVRRRAEKELRRRANMAFVVAETSRRLVNVPLEGLADVIDRTLEAIGHFAGADRAYVFELRDDGRLKDNTHEWCAEGVEPEIESLQGLRVDDYPFWMEPLQRLEAVHIPRVRDLPDSAHMERQHLEEQHIQSMVLVPIAWEDALVGFLGFDSVDAVRDWRPEDTALLETVGDVLVHAIQRARGEQALRDAEGRVRQLEKMEAVGRLAGGVAHDFNNILSVIETNAGFLRGALAAEDPLHLEVAEILEASGRAAELTRQLLAFGRRQVQRPRPRDVNDVVVSIERMLRRLVGENVVFETRLAPDLRPILADRAQLEQVIMNLVLNARDAMPHGGALRIETANIDDEPESADSEPGGGHRVMLAVTDTGGGMDEETRQRIFEPFFTTKKVGCGSGLGLATVYGIVMQSAGEISIDSALGRGSTFKIFFPAVSGQPVPTPLPDTPPPSTEPPARRPAVVLVVEDERAVRRAASRILSRLGYEVVEAKSGEEALVLAAELEEPPDVLLSDVIMPGMSGPETVDKLREEWPGLAVLFMSGYPDDALAHHGVLSSEIALLEKPFSAERLAQAVRGALERTRSKTKS